MIRTQMIIAFFDELPNAIQTIVNKTNSIVKIFADGDALESYLVSNRVDLCLIPYDIDLINRLNFIDSEIKLIIITEDNHLEFNPNVFYLNKNHLDENFFFNIINYIRISRTRDEFIGTLLHDARSPINSMIGYLELLENGVFGQLEEGQSKILYNIMTLGDMVIELIDDLNMLYQLENKAFQLKISPFNFLKTLEEVLIAVWVQADKKDIKIHKEITPKMPKIVGDSGKIQRVMMNLIINAIKFSPEKSRITIGLNLENESHVRFWVSDEGPGIPVSEISDIFKKYYHNIELSKKQRGFGLGLYISKYIIEAHHGQIWVQNNPQGGATFSFSLPAES